MVAIFADRRGFGSTTLRGRLVGAGVLSIAGTWWGWGPITCFPISPAIAHLILLTVALMLFAAAASAIRAYRGPAVLVDRRLMAVSIALEVPAIVVGTNLVTSLGRPDLALPVVGLVVGLHFLPMARALSYPPYRVLGLAVTTFALVAMALPGTTGLTILGAGSSASLLLTSLHMTHCIRARTRMTTDASQTA